MFLKEKIRKVIVNHNVFIYVNVHDSRLHDYNIGKMRSGIFYIAHELGIPITPIAFDLINPAIGGALQDQDYHIKVGDTSIVKDPVDSLIETKKFLQTSVREFRDNDINKQKLKRHNERKFNYELRKNAKPKDS